MNTMIHNISFMNAERNYNISTKKRSKSAEKLSSGYQINRSADDAANLEISESMRRQIRGLNQGFDNIQDGISLVQVADGALEQVQEILQRMGELSLKAANETNTIVERSAIQSELNALALEISRIGTSTTYNEKPLFDDPDDVMNTRKSITSLVTSSAANSGYLTDAIQVNDYWLPSATLDFSNINESNISLLNNGGFSFCCSRGCDEVFDFTFKTDGTPSSSSNLSGKVHHYYTVDISTCKNGKDLVNKIYEYVSNNLPVNNGMNIEATTVGSGVNKLPGALAVSHSNNMIKTPDGNGLLIYANAKVVSFNKYVAAGYPTEAEAKSAYPTKAPGYTTEIKALAGKIDCSSLTNIKIYNKDTIREFQIQCSGNSADAQFIYTHKVNAEELGVAHLDVTTSIGADKAITAISAAISSVSSQRSELGSHQNRLEHSINNNRSITENTQAAESLIRDTDISKEIVGYSKHNIMMQAGTAVMTQAKQSTKSAYALLH